MNPAEPVLYVAKKREKIIECLPRILTPDTYPGMPMILCGENESSSGGEPVMTCLHVDAEKKVESAKEEVEVYVHLRFSG